MSEYSEKWAEFCFLLSENIKSALSEKDFENQVVRALEVLGWSEFRKEIERQPEIQLGSARTIRPDLIIYGNDKKTLIVIEVKRPSPSDDAAQHKAFGQLTSYMRLMKSDFGFLIGDNIRVYYDGQSNPSPDLILLEKIDFDKSSKAGTNFLELFNKRSFLNGEYQEYLMAKISKFNKKQEVKSIIDKLLSAEIKETIIKQLRNEFAEIGDETFSEAIEQLRIDISRKYTTDMQSEKPERSLQIPKREPLDRLQAAASDTPSDNYPNLHKIKGWAQKTHQANHKIVRAFLALEKKGEVSLDELQKICSDKTSEYYVKDFRGNYAAMKTDGGHPHGKVFYDDRRIVSVWPIVLQEIQAYFEKND